MMAISSAAPFPYTISRGPILIGSVTFVLLVPYVCALSIQTLIYIALLLFGIFITVCDAALLLENHLRNRLAEALNVIVMDDILRSIFDPELGWIACFISTFVGNATMYALPMTQDQRMRLVQSCLWTSEEQTRKFFTLPGGVKEVFPLAFREWLEGNLENETKPPTPIVSNHYRNKLNLVVEVEASETSDDETSERDHLVREFIHAEATCKGNSLPRGIEAFPEPKQRHRPQHETQSSLLPPAQIFESPVDAMTSIIQDLSINAMKKACSNLPNTILSAAGIAASTGCLLHLRASPRARRIISGVVEGTASLTLASVALGAISALIAKHCLESDQLPNPQRSSSSQLRFPLATALAKLLNKGATKQWKGAVAFIVLFLIGRVRNAQTQTIKRRQYVS